VDSKFFETSSFFQTDFCCDGLVASALDSRSSGSLQLGAHSITVPLSTQVYTFLLLDYFLFHGLFLFSFFFVNCSNNGLLITIIAIYLLALLRDPELLQQLVETANVET